MPLQKIETIDEPRSRIEAQGDLFDPRKAHPDDFRNMLIWGDNKLVMASLLRDFKGKIDLIYIDPPFDVGADFTMSVPLGDEREAVQKEQSTLEMVAYRDMWGRGTDSYLHMMYERLVVMRDLLAEHGTLYVHLGWQVAYAVRLLLEEIFGKDQLVNEIIWKRQSAHSDTVQGADHFGRIHDIILYARKSDHFVLNMQYDPYSAETLESAYRYVEEGTGRRYSLGDITAPGGGKVQKGNPRYEFLGITRYWRFSQERMQELYQGGELCRQRPDGSRFRNDTLMRCRALRCKTSGRI